MSVSNILNSLNNQNLPYVGKKVWFEAINLHTVQEDIKLIANNHVVKCELFLQ